MDDRKQQQQQPSGKPLAMQAPPAEEREDLIWDALPTLGTGSKTWHVVVRHSPFIFKRAKVRAETKDEAKRVFIDEVRRRHEERANKQPMDEWGRLTAKRVRDAMTEGLRADGAAELGWTINLADDEVAKRQQQKAKVGDRWDDPRLQLVGR